MSHDEGTRAWDGLLSGLLADPVGEAGAAPTAGALRGLLLDRARRLVRPGVASPPVDRAVLVPADVRAGGSYAVAAHLERETTRAVVRARYRLADPGLLDADPAGAGDPAWHEPVPRLHLGRPCDPAWVARLAAEVDAHLAWCLAQGLPPVPPNSMNRYGLLLEDLGLAPLLDRLRERVVVPLARQHFADLGGAELDHQHAFVAVYEPDGDRDLALHLDDSGVTLNLCLGQVFEGGDLQLSGLRCAHHAQGPSAPRERARVAHVPGQALVHAGWHRHEALPLRGGRRLALILWCRSSALRAVPDGRMACGPWCGAR